MKLLALIHFAVSVFFINGDESTGDGRSVGNSFSPTLICNGASSPEMCGISIGFANTPAFARASNTLNPDRLVETLTPRSIELSKRNSIISKPESAKREAKLSAYSYASWLSLSIKNTISDVWPEKWPRNITADSGNSRRQVNLSLIRSASRSASAVSFFASSISNFWCAISTSDFRWASANICRSFSAMRCSAFHPQRAAKAAIIAKPAAIICPYSASRAVTSDVSPEPTSETQDAKIKIRNVILIVETILIVSVGIAWMYSISYWKRRKNSHGNNE